VDQPESRPRGSFLSIVLALMVAVALFVGLFFLTLGLVGPILVLGVGVFALAAFHYLVWGWWLSGAIRRDVEEEERAEQAHHTGPPKPDGRDFDER
jgi:hypothetical protein